MTTAQKRPLVMVSGYYGFDNLGDEAILEEICNELTELAGVQNIIVLSANPAATTAKFGVQSIKRTDVKEMMRLLTRCRLFISGGGGLFQNTRSLGSIVFYGLQIVLARLLGARAMIFAQGIGPLRGAASAALTKFFFSLANQVTVRDDQSAALLRQWNIEAARTADPVWRLTESPPPDDEVQKHFSDGRPVFALSLRSCGNLDRHHVETLAEKLDGLLPPDAHILLLPLQEEQDLEPLRLFEGAWSKRSRSSSLLNTSKLVRPSQWIALFKNCRALVGMRLHAIIMALKAGIPVAGIAYDPKVAHVLTEFEQPCLILTKEGQPEQWEEALKPLVYAPHSLVERTSRHLEVAQNLSCQNFTILARILACKEVVG